MAQQGLHQADKIQMALQTLSWAGLGVFSVVSFSTAHDRSLQMSTQTMALQNADQGSQHIDMNVVPRVCRSECYRAYEETQKLRKTPELCRTNSVFTENYASCTTCILHRSDEGDDWTNANKFYLQPAFGEYVAYCNSFLIQSVVKTPSSSSRPATTLSTSSARQPTSRVTTITAITLTTEPPKETVFFVSTSTTIAPLTSETPAPTTTYVAVISSVVRIPVSPSTSTPLGLPSPTVPLFPPSLPSISLTATVTIIVVPICSTILLIAGLVYLYFFLRKRRKQKKTAAHTNGDKDGATLSKTSTWEKGEMNARLSTLPRQEMEDWRGVEDMGPHELPVGAPAQEIMNVEASVGSGEVMEEEERMVADSPTLSGRETTSGNTPSAVRRSVGSDVHDG